MDAQAYQTSPMYVLASGSIRFPLAKKGTESMTFAFSDTAPFGNVQWQLYSGAAIAAEQAGQLDAANFPAARSRSVTGILGDAGVRLLAGG
jgi:hypothetical protein